MFFRDQQQPVSQTRRKPNHTSQVDTRRRNSSIQNHHHSADATDVPPSSQGGGARLHSERPDALVHEGVDIPVVTPTDIFQRLNHLVRTSSANFTNVWVCGELVNVSPKTRSGHMYFELKDGHGSKLSCTLFGVDRVVSKEVQEMLCNGTQVLARGQVRFACKYNGSQYQCNVREVRIQTTEEGTHEQQLAAWTKELQEEGCFEAHRKQSIPKCPRVVAVVTSDGGAALQDIRQTLQDARAPLVLRVYPCTVQGDHCVSTIIQQLEHICETVRTQKTGNNVPDMVLIARGGGSREDLWAFNDPVLVRKIDYLRAHCHLPPTVCAIGHQVDNPLLEKVCDGAHITPTYAAQALAEPFASMRSRADAVHEAMQSQTMQTIAQHKLRHTQLASQARQFQVVSQIQCMLQRAHSHIEQQVAGCLQQNRNQLQKLLRKAIGSSPWCALHQHPNLALLKNENGVDDLDMTTLHRKDKSSRGTMVLSTRDGQVKLHYRMGSM
jgi:exodeoxyribonuclease VII large subunit